MDGSNREIGVGTYTTVGTTLSRDTVTASLIAGVAGTTKLTLSGSATVFITLLAADLTAITISDTAPASPVAGNLWWDSTDGTLYIYYTDVNTSQWVGANSAGGNFRSSYGQLFSRDLIFP